MTAGGWPLVGRDTELAALVRALRGGRHAALVGPPGVGARRLALDAARRVAGNKVHQVVAATGGGALPLGTLRPLIGAVDNGAAWEELSRVVARDAVVIVVDAHHLDDVSAVLVHQLSLVGRTVVLTAASGAPLPAALLHVLRAPGTVRLQLAPLGADDIEALLRKVLGGRVEGRVLHQLAELSEGLPLQLRELVRGVVGADRLVDDGRIIRLTGDIVLTPVLEDVARHRIAGLDAPAAEALRLVAVAERLDLDLSTRLFPMSVLADLEARDLVRLDERDGPPVVELAHPLDGVWLRSTLGKITRIALARRIDDLAREVGFAERGSREDQLAVVWAVRAGQPVADARLTLTARKAVERGQVELGAELALAAFAQQPTAQSAVVASWNLDRFGRHDQALDVLVQASGQVEAPWDRAWVAKREAEERWWWQHDTAQARRTADPAAHDPGPGRDLLEAQNAMFDLLDGDPEGALARVRPLEGHRHREVATLVGMVQALALGFSDRGREAVRIAAASRAAANVDREDDPRSPGNFHVLTGMLGLQFDGRLDEVGPIADLVYEVAIGHRDREAQGWASLFVANVAFFRGDLVSAGARFTEAEICFVECGLPGIARWAVIAGALSAFGRREPATARATLARIDALPDAGFRVFDPLVELGRAWEAMAEGRPREADDAGRLAAKTAATGGSWALLAHVAHDLARMGRTEVAGEAAELLPDDRGPLTACRLRFVAAIAAGDEAGLLAAADRFEHFGARLWAAEALALVVARRRADGRRRATQSAATRLAALVAACPGARTPLLDAAGPAAGLSSRELEVARLARLGRPNREIAEQLGVSHRTVENHLYRAFAKLGISRREELPEALDDLGVPPS